MATGLQSALLHHLALSRIAVMPVESVCMMRLDVRSQRRQLLISEGESCGRLDVAVKDRRARKLGSM
jgi:hypothetical protein